LLSNFVNLCANSVSSLFCFLWRAILTHCFTWVGRSANPSPKLPKVRRPHSCHSEWDFDGFNT